MFRIRPSDRHRRIDRRRSSRPTIDRSHFRKQIIYIRYSPRKQLLSFLFFSVFTQNAPNNKRRLRLITCSIFIIKRQYKREFNSLSIYRKIRLEFSILFTWKGNTLTHPLLSRLYFQMARATWIRSQIR